MLRTLLRPIRQSISSELIKKDISNKIKTRGVGGDMLEYPRTFQQKIILLNDPRTIQKLQIVQFGVKYKPGKKYLALILSLSALFFYINQKRLPERVVDHYFAISNTSNLDRPSGFLLAAFMYEQPFVIYLPLLTVVHQMSKFISQRWIFGLFAANLISNGILGKYLVDKRVQKYEVWDQERVTYGEGTVMSLAMILWGALGPVGGFTALKSRIFLKSVPGLGIIRAGIPIGYICLFYMLLQGYFFYKQKKNSQLMCVSTLLGFATGLLVRRFSPLK